MQAGRHPWLWGVVGTAVMCAIFFLVTFLITVLLTGEGATDGGAKIGVIAIEGVISSDLTERTVRQLTKYGDDASIKAIILGSIVQGAG
jgi:hypothetical protein